MWKQELAFLQSYIVYLSAFFVNNLIVSNV